MIEQAEATALLEESPELQRFNNRLRLINELREDAAAEQDPELIKDAYETVLRLSGRLHAEILAYYIEEHSKQFEAVLEVCNERMRIIEELEDMLKKAYGLDNENDIDAPQRLRDKSHLKIVKK